MSEDAVFSQEVIDGAIRKMREAPQFLSYDIKLDGAFHRVVVVPAAVPKPDPSWGWTKLAVGHLREAYAHPDHPGRLYVWDEYIPWGQSA